MGAQYKLLSEHYINDQLLPAGAVIGEGTPFPYEGEPSMQMEAVNDEGKAKLDKQNERRADPVESLKVKGK